MTTDQGGNVRNAVERELGWDWLPCQAHICNLAVNHAVSHSGHGVAELLASCSQIASHFRVGNRWDKFREVQLALAREQQAAALT